MEGRLESYTVSCALERRGVMIQHVLRLTYGQVEEIVEHALVSYGWMAEIRK